MIEQRPSFRLRAALFPLMLFYTRRVYLNVPFAAHDLMAELEGRRFVSAFDTLTSTGVHR